jgi:Amt family ammonium transporter
LTPALAFFYGGLVRSKNALNTMMMSMAALGVVGLVWAVAGYSLAFGQGNAFVGGLQHVLLRGVGIEAHGTIPHVLFLCYQGTFAVITAALISGAVVERMRFGPYLAFIAAWTVLVYAPVCHWVWGGGWLASLGALDFAGGTVVHVNAAAALVAAAVLGPRRDYGRQALLPHSKQAVAVAAAALYSGGVSFALLKAIGWVTALRSSLRHEGLGLDVAMHGEEAYGSGEGAILVLPSETPAPRPATVEGLPIPVGGEA